MTTLDPPASPLAAAHGPGLGEFKRGWPVVLATFIAIPFSLVALGKSYSIGLLSHPLAEEFGWSRGSIMLAPIAITCGLIPASYAVGWIADRYGSRRMITLSLLGFGLCFFALAAFPGREVWTFLGLYLLMGMVAAGTLSVGYMRTVVGWFRDRLGLALAIAMSGTGVAGVLAPLVIGWAIEQHGWRGAYVVLGLLPIVVAAPVVFFLLKDAPAPAPRVGAEPALEGAGVLESLRSWRFWAMALGFTLVLTTLVGLVTNLAPLLRDRGLGVVQAAQYASVIGASVIVGRLAAGVLLDRIWAPLLCCAAFTVNGAALVVLAAPDLSPAATLAVIAVTGLALGVEGDVAAYMVRSYFGRRCFGRLYAIQLTIANIGAGLGPAAYGFAFDAQGTYGPALGVAGGALALVGLGFLTLGRYPAFGGKP